MSVTQLPVKSVLPAEGFKPFNSKSPCTLGFSAERAANIFISTASLAVRFLGGFRQNETSGADNHKKKQFEGLICFSSPLYHDHNLSWLVCVHERETEE